MGLDPGCLVAMLEAQVELHTRLPWVFQQASRTFLNLQYANADVPLNLCCTAATGVRLLLRCGAQLGLGGTAAQIEGLWLKHGGFCKEHQFGNRLAEVQQRTGLQVALEVV